MPLTPPGYANVRTPAELVAAVGDLSSDAATTIRLAPGIYTLTAQLEIFRPLTLEAEIPGSVVLDARADTTSVRRVIYIDEGTASGSVDLIGLNITGGRAYTASACFSRTGSRA